MDCIYNNAVNLKHMSRQVVDNWVIFSTILLGRLLYPIPPQTPTCNAGTVLLTCFGRHIIKIVNHRLHTKTKFTDNIFFIGKNHYQDIFYQNTVYGLL